MNIKTIGIYAYISYDLQIIGGLEAQVYHLSKELRQRGYQVILHCFYNAKEIRKEYTEDGIFKFSSQYFIENLNCSRLLQEDIIFSFGIRDGKIQDIASRVAKTLDKKHVTFVYFTKEESDWRSTFDSNKNTTTFKQREEYMNNFRNVCKEVVEGADLVIVPTEYVRGQLVSCVNYLDYGKIKVCYHGIKIEDTIPNRAKWLKEKPTFIHASRLKYPESLDKGIVWTDKLASKTDGKFYICGNGDCPIMSKNIERKGLLSQHKLFELMRNECWYSLIPSQMEAGCTIALESVMCECLPIALNMAGLAEVMKMIGLEEYLVEPEIFKVCYGVSLYVPRDISSIIKKVDNKKIKKFLKDLENSQEIIKKSYSIERTTDKLLKIIGEEL